jgi:hypothetical protein
MRTGLPSPLVPSPALSKTGTQGELLGGQSAEAGGPGLQTYPWGPHLCFLQGSYPVRPSQNLAMFQASPLFSSPEHQNQHRVVTLRSTGSTGNGLFLLGTFLTLSVNLYYLSSSLRGSLGSSFFLLSTSQVGRSGPHTPPSAVSKDGFHQDGNSCAGT